MESCAPGVVVKNLAIIPYAAPNTNIKNAKRQYPFTYEQVLTCYNRLCGRKEHLTMTNDYSKEKIAEILFTFVKLYENFQFSLPFLRKYGFQYVLPIDFKAEVGVAIDPSMKALILDILNATNNNGCQNYDLLADFINTFETDYAHAIKETTSTPHHAFTDSIQTIFDKFSTESAGERTMVKKVPKFVGAEVCVSDNEIIYLMILNALRRIQTKFFPEPDSDLSQLIAKIKEHHIHHSDTEWKPTSQWHITSYFVGKKSSIPDSEYLKKFIEGVQISVRCDVLLYVPNKLVMSVVHAPNLRLHSSIKIPSVVWLINASSVGLGRTLCENLFESYQGLGNLYLTGFFQEPSGVYCEAHKVVIGKETVECYVVKVMPKVEVSAETKFFYNQLNTNYELSRQGQHFGGQLALCSLQYYQNYQEKVLKMRQKPGFRPHMWSSGSRPQFPGARAPRPRGFNIGGPPMPQPGLMPAQPSSFLRPPQDHFMEMEPRGFAGGSHPPRPQRQKKMQRSYRELAPSQGFNLGAPMSIDQMQPTQQQRRQLRGRPQSGIAEGIRGGRMQGFSTAPRAPRPIQESMQDEQQMPMRRAGRERTSAIDVKGEESLSRQEMLQHFGQFGSIVDLEMGAGDRSAVVTYEQPVLWQKLQPEQRQATMAKTRGGMSGSTAYSISYHFGGDRMQRREMPPTQWRPKQFSMAEEAKWTEKRKPFKSRPQVQEEPEPVDVEEEEESYEESEEEVAESAEGGEEEYEEESEEEEQGTSPRPDLREIIAAKRGKVQPVRETPKRAEQRPPEVKRPRVAIPASQRLIAGHLAANKLLDRKKKEQPESIEERVEEPEPEEPSPAPRITPKAEAKGKIVGKCMSMCPPSEIKEREERHGLSIFEVDPAAYSPQMSQTKGYIKKAKPEWAVKQFVRSAADRKMDDERMIRPPRVLVDTLNYMLDNLLDADKHNKKGYVVPPNGHWLIEIYTFVSDRTRAIRQDFNLQKTDLTRSYIDSFEKIARFHLMCSNHCIGLEGFDAVQNSEQFTSTLTSLREAYTAVREKIKRRCVKGKQINSEEVYQSPHEAEFYAYSILWQTHQTFQLNQFLAQLPKELVSTPEIALALKTVGAYNTGNYTRVVSLVKEMPYLFSCASLNLLNEARKNLIMNLVSATDRNGVSTTLKEVKNWLLFNTEEEAERFCEWLTVLDSAPKIDTKIALRKSQRPRTGPWIMSKCNAIEEKIEGKLRADIIKGKVIKAIKPTAVTPPKRETFKVVHRKDLPKPVVKSAEPLPLPTFPRKLHLPTEATRAPFSAPAFLPPEPPIVPPKVSPFVPPRPTAPIVSEVRAPRPVIDDTEARRMKEIRMQKRRKEKKEHAELCIKLLRFTMWRKYIHIKKAILAERKRILKGKLEERFVGHYGVTYGPAAGMSPEISPEAEIIMEEEYTLPKEWLTELLRRKIAGEAPYEYWVKLLLCMDLSKYETNTLNDWLVKQVTANHCSLSKVNEFDACVFRKNGETADGHKLSYCVNLAYQLKKEITDKSLQNGFDYIHGSRVILFVMSTSLKEDIERFELLMANLPEKASVSLIIFYMQKMMQEQNQTLSNIQGKQEFQRYLENTLNLKDYQRREKVGYYRFKHLKFYFPSHQTLLLYPKIPDKLLLDITESVDQALSFTDIPIKLSYLPLHVAYTSTSLSELKRKRHNLESLNYYVAYFNSICKVVQKKYKEGLKQRAKLVPEFLSTKGIFQIYLLNHNQNRKSNTCAVYKRHEYHTKNNEINEFCSSGADNGQ
eukprot:TRINITY_DN357_c0_g1_i1.p1 TRINITY_DN357_c0_g1~~TRINITY_DN357_c0_g1_i1.p1  ORF type:complete len:1760 (+),score=117.76 TRINITY_DN357_c0_g1_i1:6764-12043(+)